MKVIKKTVNIPFKSRERFESTDFILGVNFSSSSHPLNVNYTKFIKKQRRDARHDFI